VLYGSIQFGMVEENAGENALVLRNITQNETIHIPTGMNSSLTPANTECVEDIYISASSREIAKFARLGTESMAALLQTPCSLSAQSQPLNPIPQFCPCIVRITMQCARHAAYTDHIERLQ
jgi:hypothetical protein